MNRLFVLCIVSAFISTTHTFGQGKLYTITIKMQDNNNAVSVFPNVEIMIDGHKTQASPQAEILFTSSNNAGLISVAMPDEREYVIVGSSTVYLPPDPYRNLTILIRKVTQKDQAMLQVTGTLKKLNIRINELDSIRTANFQQYQNMERILDSVLKIASAKYPVSESDLRTATEKMQGRDLYFVQISTCLEHYLNEAKDIKDVFRDLLAFSLENPKSFRLFDSILYVYNDAYNKLNDHNDEYEKAVLDYWDSKELSLNFHSVFDYAINYVHRNDILPLNRLFTVKVNEYIHEKSKSRRKELKKEIIDILNNTIPILENALPILETKVRYFNDQLEAQKNIYTP